MRSTIGLLALLLLPSCYAIASYENVIACVMRERLALWDHGPPVSVPVSFRWKDSFVEDTMFGIPDCGLESIGMTCRLKYTDVSYAVPLNKTVDVVLDSWSLSDENTTEESTVKADLFQCMKYNRAEEPEVPDGSWSDRLTAGNVYMGKCQSEDEWLKRATAECGKAPTNHTLGARCGTNDTYLEIVFVCDRIENATLFEVDEKFIEHKKTYQHESQIAILERFAEIAEKLSVAKMHNDTEMMKTYTVQLDKAFETARQAIKNSHDLSDMFTVGYDADDWALRHGYSSREYSLSKAKRLIRGISQQRSGDLFLMAAHQLVNDSDAIDGVYSGQFVQILTRFHLYDVDTLFEQLEKVMYWTPEPYPELKGRIVDYYVDYIKNHTLGISREHLGFLNESGAHAQLLDMYADIFNPGLIDRKYLQKPNGSVWIYVFVAVVFFMVTPLFAIRWSKDSNRVADVKIKFEKFRMGGEDEKLVKDANIDNPNLEV